MKTHKCEVITECSPLIDTAKNDSVAEVDLNFLLTGMLFLAVAGVAGAYALSVESTIQATFTTNSLSYNATGNAMTGIANINSQFGLIGTIIVAVVVLGLIFLLFQYVRS